MGRLADPAVNASVRFVRFEQVQQARCLRGAPKCGRREGEPAPQVCL